MDYHKIIFELSGTDTPNSGTSSPSRSHDVLHYLLIATSFHILPFKAALRWSNVRESATFPTGICGTHVNLGQYQPENKPGLFKQGIPGSCHYLIVKDHKSRKSSYLFYLANHFNGRRSKYPIHRSVSTHLTSVWSANASYHRRSQQWRDFRTDTAMPRDTVLSA